MTNSRIPSLLCGEKKDLKSALIHVAESIGISKDEVCRLFNLLPPILQKSPAFYNLLIKLWCYDFGESIQLPNGSVVIGAHMFPPVDRLLRVLSFANKRLSEAKFANYIQRLSNPAKHQDVLVEMLPIFGVDATIKCDFEVSGYGVGNRTIDWLICPSGRPAVLFDVKCRMKDLIEGLDQISLGHRGPNGQGPAPIHDVSILFKDTEGKFIANSPNAILQGVWIISQLQQERSELQSVFDSTDPMKLHFAILANRERDAYVLTRSGIKLELITSLFGITHSDRLVFDRQINHGHNS